MDKVNEQIYIGDSDDYKSPDLEKIDTVICVSTPKLDVRKQLERPLIHVPLRDGESPQLSFTQAVDLVKTEIKREGTSILVTCMNGVSRSSTVIATALASLNETSFKDELERIKESRPKVNPRPEMIKQAKIYLGERR